MASLPVVWFQGTLVPLTPVFDTPGLEAMPYRSIMPLPVCNAYSDLK